MKMRSTGRISLKKLRNVLFAAAVLTAGAAPLAQAQTYDRPPTDVPDRGYEQRGDTSTVLRVDRLENQVRSLNGQVEQLQFQVKRLEDQLHKFQADVDQRFQESAAHGAVRPTAAVPQKRSDLSESDPDGAPQQAAESLPQDPPQVTPPNLAPPSPNGRRRDAFDPDALPSAAGAPRPLGSAESASKPAPRSAEGRRDPTAPLDLTPPGLRGQTQAASPVTGGGVASLDPSLGATPAALPADPVKAEYDAAADLLKTQHYDAAQQGFAAFLQKNPHSRLIAPATYHLGESYYYQSRHREAAEQFLKIATDFSKSSVAPDAMVKLGVSLNALGAKEQACAFFSELPRKYPNAPVADKTAAAREAKKAAC
jgi:tol-pal system protein YbgF